MQVVTQWPGAGNVDPQLLSHRIRGDFWDVLKSTGATLLLTREYEHCVLALNPTDKPRVTTLHLPHPSGLVVDRKRSTVHIASTRNPNQIFQFAAANAAMRRRDGMASVIDGVGRLLPVASRFYPGSLYLHDLALIGGKLHGNAVGLNAIVDLSAEKFKTVWRPKTIDEEAMTRNHLQLNSIAAGSTVSKSFFSASAEAPSSRRPGHRNFPVDRRGVIFCGETGEPMARGLTRPHSARLFGRQVWVANSGYGEVGFVKDGGFQSVCRLPGWTRGLCFVGDVAFVGTSRVIPRFRQYAPGLDVDKSICALHAVDTKSGKTLGSMIWPIGNQIFAIDWAPAKMVRGFPFAAGAGRARKQERSFFYSYVTEGSR